MVVVIGSLFLFPLIDRIVNVYFPPGTAGMVNVVSAWVKCFGPVLSSIVISKVIFAFVEFLFHVKTIFLLISSYFAVALVGVSSLLYFSETFFGACPLTAYSVVYFAFWCIYTSQYWRHRAFFNSNLLNTCLEQ